MNMVLNDVCEVYSGYALKSFNEGKEGFPVIKIGNILTDGRLSLEDCQYTTETVNTKYYSQKDDVYVALSGATTGKIGLMETDESYVINQRVGVVRRKDKKIPSRFIKYFLLKQTERILQEAAGCAQPNISPKQIGAYTFPSFSSEKMEEITRELDKVTNVIQYRYKQNNLLDCLIKARFVEMFGDPIDNFQKWPVKKLKDISSLITNGNTPKGGSSNYVNEGIIFIRSQNVWRNRIDLSDVVYIDESTHNGMSKSSVHHNDILITKTGRINTENSSLGRAALYQGDDNTANINGHVYLVRLKDCVNPQFVVTILTSEAYRKYIRKVCVGGIDKRQINLDQVENFPIIQPPLADQIMFASLLKQIDKSKVVVPAKIKNAIFAIMLSVSFGQITSI